MPVAAPKARHPRPSGETKLICGVEILLATPSILSGEAALEVSLRGETSLHLVLEHRGGVVYHQTASTTGERQPNPTLTTVPAGGGLCGCPDILPGGHLGLPSPLWRTFSGIRARRRRELSPAAPPTIPSQ